MKIVVSVAVWAASAAALSATTSPRVARLAEVLRRYEAGQELLRQNAGVPIVDQQGVLDAFVAYLRDHLEPNELEMLEGLERMRSGSFLNMAGGTAGASRLVMTKACLTHTRALRESLLEWFFQQTTTARVELLPSTTMSIEATVAVLAREGRTRERPTKILLPSDAHYAWHNVLRIYDRDPFVRVIALQTDDASLGPLRALDQETGREVLRQGDFVVGVYTLANTVSGRATPTAWFDAALDYARAKGASTHVFVDAALSGLVSPFRAVEERDDSRARGIPGSGALLGLVTSGFKDFLNCGSLLFFDDEHLECCAQASPSPDEGSLAATVAGAAHPLISLAPITSIPESPLVGFLALADDYADFRLSIFRDFRDRLRETLADLSGDLRIESFFPILHLDVHDADLASAVYAAPELEKFSLIAIDAEPSVIRIFPTPTNHAIIPAIRAALGRLMEGKKY